MCGIFAIVSFCPLLTLYDAAVNLGEKARKLSYRGTQSAGMLIETKREPDTFYKRILQDKVVCKGEKQTNPFLELFEAFYKGEEVTKEKVPFVGMIHTRWATTGGEPTEETAQPMKSEDSGEFVLVLNGNLTNAVNMRNEIIEKSANKINFKTSTDTEVIARLFYENYHEARRRKNMMADECGPNVIKFEDLCKEVSGKCKGFFTIVVKSKHYPDEIVSFANRQPLYIGFGSEDSKEFKSTKYESIYECPGGDYFEFGSDSWALNKNIKYFYKLEDGDIAKVSKNGLLLDRNPSKEYTREEKKFPKIMEYEYKEVNIGAIEGSLHREINEQGQCLASIINARLKDGNIEFNEIGNDIISKLLKKKHFYFLGCGSSCYVGMSVKQAFRDLAFAETAEEINASMFVDNGHIVDPENSAYFFITQSGTTSDTNRALEYCLDRNALCIGVTNIVPSTASEKCHATIEVMAGFEVAVASTKAYTSQSIQLFMFAAMLGMRKATEYSDAKLNGLANGYGLVNGYGKANGHTSMSSLTNGDLKENGHAKPNGTYLAENLSDDEPTLVANPAVVNSLKSVIERGRKDLVGSDKEIITSEMLVNRINYYTEDLITFAEKVNEVLVSDISKLIEFIANARNSNLILVSRGSQFPTIVEAVLKITEVTQIPSLCYYSSELAHGPVAMVSKKSFIILLEPPEAEMQEKFFLVFEKIGTANAVPLVIRTDANSVSSYDPGCINSMITLPGTNYLLQGILTAIAFQRAVHDVCVSFGNSPDVLPNLAKSVTVPT